MASDPSTHGQGDHGSRPTQVRLGCQWLQTNPGTAGCPWLQTHPGTARVSMAPDPPRHGKGVNGSRPRHGWVSMAPDPGTARVSMAPYPPRHGEGVHGSRPTQARLGVKMAVMPIDLPYLKTPYCMRTSWLYVL